jgi:D-arabinose 5-phosphate isomerase GutQ
MASRVGYIERIYRNIEAVDPLQVESLYNCIRNAGVIIPSGEGRSKGALSIACSEMAKMRRGKVVVDRSDIGFPGKGLADAAPILKRRFGHVCLLINSGNGRSLMPLLDAQDLAAYIAKTNNHRDFSINAVTSDPESPIGVLSSKFGNTLVLKGREPTEAPTESSEFRASGILEDLFILGSGIIFQSLAQAMYEEAQPPRVLDIAKGLYGDVARLVDEIVASDFYRFVVDRLEARSACFFAGLMSSKEAARMTAVRLAHVKRALGDEVYVAGENPPAPRAGDLLIVISYSGETEVVVSWCRGFKRLGGSIAAIVGREGSTLTSVADHHYVVRANPDAEGPNDFYIKAAFALSPLPILLVERAEERGLRLPEYLLKWYHSVTS